MRDLRTRLFDSATILLVMCALIVTGVTVTRALRDRRSRPGSQPPIQVADWANISSKGYRVGPNDAKVTMVVFSDFECPACREFALRTFPELQKRHPGQISLMIRHWPLAQHRFSYPAARAAECAASQGQFKAFHDSVFVHQDRLGFLTFHDLAAGAGVLDLVSFDQCAALETPVARIDEDSLAVRQLGGTGTPTVLVNGWLLREGASLIVLDSMVKGALTKGLDR